MVVKCTMYQLKVDVNMLDAVKSVSVLDDVSSISPSSEQKSSFALTKG